jgi:hypothetical protein
MSNPFQSVQNFIGRANTIVNNVKKAVSVAEGISNGSINPFGFMKNIRSANLQPGAMPTFKTRTNATVNTARGENDWRVKLSVPPQYNALSSPLLSPLITETGGNMVFPFTPSILMTHSASYNAMQPIHTNYPFQNYQHSSVDAITIAGDFFVETDQDARYWIAVIHYLRSVTKMFYGAGPEQGSPPPVVRLNGYGDYVFNNVPVVVTSFNVELPTDVNYIKTGLTGSAATNGNSAPASGWVPTQSAITVTVMPTYSRGQVSQFNMKDFVSGSYVTGSNKGFI